MPIKLVSRLFFRVTFLAALVVPTFCLVNVRLIGVTTVCAMPVPDMGTVCGLPGALSKTFSVADSAPSEVGVYVKLTLHPMPAVSVGPQVFDEITKSLFPLTLMPFRSRMEYPVFTFLMVTVLVVLVVSIAWLPKLMEEGKSVGGRGTFVDQVNTVPHPSVSVKQDPPANVVP